MFLIEGNITVAVAEFEVISVKDKAIIHIIKSSIEGDKTCIRASC